MHGPTTNKQHFAKSWANWGLATLLGLSMVLTTAMSMAIIMYLALLVHGGQDLVVEALKVDGKGYQDIIKWPVILISFPVGMFSGVRLWRWIVEGFGLLTPEQLKEWTG